MNQTGLKCSSFFLCYPWFLEQKTYINQTCQHPLVFCSSKYITVLFSKDELKRDKYIQCYMYETGASEDDARKYIGFLIYETWKKLNEDGNANSPFSRTFIGIAMNLPRMAECTY